MVTAARLYQNRFLTPNEFAELSALARDLEQLCAEGLLEAFRAEDNVVRYRPALQQTLIEEKAS